MRYGGNIDEGNQNVTMPLNLSVSFDCVYHENRESILCPILYNPYLNKHPIIFDINCDHINANFSLEVNFLEIGAEYAENLCHMEMLLQLI